MKKLDHVIISLNFNFDKMIFFFRKNKSVNDNRDDDEPRREKNKIVVWKIGVKGFVCNSRPLRWQCLSQILGCIDWRIYQYTQMSADLFRQEIEPLH